MSAGWRAWVLAARPATLPVSVIPVAVGSACAAASGGFSLKPALAALFGAVLIQIGTNFANDVFDYEKGADTSERLGPTRAVQAGLLSAGAVRRAMWLCFALAGVFGAYLTYVAGPVVIAIGLASVASGIAYTGGPYPLGYHGLGDVFVLAFFGFVAVCGTAFVEAGHVPPLAWWAALPVGALATAVLVVNNLRDVETDRRAGKRTLAVRLGERAARAEYLGLVLVAYATPVALVALHALKAWALLPLLTLPFAVLLVPRVMREQGRALNARLGDTARALVLHGALFAVGIAVSA